MLVEILARAQCIDRTNTRIAARWMSLTARGRWIAERVPDVVEEAERIVLGRLSAEERAFLKRFLQRIVDKIDA